MIDQFTEIENDPTPLAAIGVAESVIGALVVKNIINVGDVVAEFRKPVPFDEVPTLPCAVPELFTA